MKKILLMLVLVLSGVLSANAQFEKGKKYVNASLSGIGMSYSSSQKFTFGLEARGGYFISDCLLLQGELGYNHTKAVDNVSVGAMAHYFFDQVGVSLGGGAEYVHFSPSSNDVQIPLEVGYHYFFNKHVTIEPAIYYKMSLHDFSNNSTFGIRIGFGFYF